MYESFWKLERRPFDNSVLGEAYYPSELHQAALLKIRYAIEHRRAAAILAGPSGIGKSMLMQKLLDQLPDHTGPIIQLDFTCLSSEQMLRYIAGKCNAEFAKHALESDTSEALATIEKFLIENCEQNRHAILMIDEGHMLDAADQLETLRQLLNVAASYSTGEAAWTLLISGMPSLIGNIYRNGALRDRLSVQCVLQPFNSHDTGAYIQHRLRWADCTRGHVFSNEAIDLIHRLTEGLPRRINSLCDLALMVGYAQEVEAIDAMMIENIHAELHPAAFVNEFAS